VTYIPIGNLSQIQDKLQRPIFEIYHDETLTDIIWNKIAQVVKGKKTVFYVPVGVFNQLAVGALYVGDNQYLSDNYDMRLLSNPSDIIERHPLDLTASTTKISLWGGIDYGMNADIVQKKQNRSAIYRGETLSNLRYAFREVTNISQMLSGNNIKNTVFSSNNATEKAFKERTREKDYIIHVSTHGFFNEKSDLHNSMMESGLFFAGANKYWSNDSISLEWGEEDGILRAAEIAQLNLSGCSLVVLSACETGLGFSDTSEGVYGLQRAFKLAGADMVLMSLWEVDDQATAMLMTEFYKNLLAGKDVDNALELGKRAVRRQYPSPEDWGGFVLLH
jgi:CHAT domain-containing protein